MLNFEIIVPFYNGHGTIDRLVQSVPDRIPITIVDDMSSTPLAELPYKNVRILRMRRKGYFTGAVNEGIKHTRGDVLILNQDIYFTDIGWLSQLENVLKEGYSYIGERIQGTRKDWPNGYIHGTYMYITREAIDETGLLNEVNYPMWGSTAEYQLRVARNNFKVLPLDKVEDFVHVREGSFGESFQEMLRKEPNNRKLFTTTPPLVSVIIPTHNFSSWLKSAVNSLVGGETDFGVRPQQSFASFEVVLVDDSSTDDTPEIIRSLLDPWKGVRGIRLNRPRVEVWHDETNKYIGKPVALNAGIRRAYGKYIVTLDADDMMEPDRLERMFEAMTMYPDGFIYDNMKTFASGEVTNNWRMNSFNFEDCLYKNQVHNSIMFTKSAWKQVGGYPERFKFGREDWAMNIRLSSNGFCGVHIVDYFGLLYRREGQNRTLENTQAKWMQYFQQEMVKEFPELYRGERKMGCCGRGATLDRTKTDAFAKTAATMDIATDGTSLVEYVGLRSPGEAFTVYGPVTGTQYRVKPDKLFRVDNRDLLTNDRKNPGILEYLEGNKYVFNVVPETPPEPMVETLDVAEPMVVQEQEMVVEEETLDTSFLDSTIAVYQIHMVENEYDLNDLKVFMAYESANKNRVTVLSDLETRIEELS